MDLSDPAAAAEKLKLGTRVAMRFAAKRKGDVLDFWFEPADADSPTTSASSESQRAISGILRGASLLNA
jgi:hypothetical protein